MTSIRLFSTFIIGTSLLISNLSLGQTKTEDLLDEMQVFFTEVLRENFGEQPDSMLYKQFFDCFNQNEGYYILNIDHNQMKEFNSKLFLDSIYFSIYLRVIFVDNVESALQHPLRKNPSVKILSNRRANGSWTNRKRIYSKIYYKPEGIIDRIIEEEKNKSVLAKKLNKLQQIFPIQIHLLDFIEHARGNFSEFENPEIRKLTTLLFWHYACYCSNFDFYERKEKCL